MATRTRSHAVTPAFVAPMECTPAASLPDDATKWLYEVKLDGYRCCAVVYRGKAALYSRYGNAWPGRFPQIAAALAELDDSLVIDGEIVALDARGLPSFQELQNWQSTKAPIIFYAFDLLHRAGVDLRRVPIEERKAQLAEIATTFRDPLRLSAPLDAELATLIPRMKALGLEGIVAKRRGTRYESGKRSQSWLKQRFNEVADLVVGGYIPGDFRLLVGEWRGDELFFLKKLKNGFTAQSRREVVEALRDLRINECPFANLPEPKGRSAVDAEVMKTVVWVKPVVNVEVEFVERTGGGKLRHASFRRLVTS